MWMQFNVIPRTTVFNARLIYNLRRSDHISDALMCLHWLRVAERIRFKMAVLTYRSLHGQTPSYLSNFVPSSARSGRPGLRSASTHRLLVPRTRLSTIGDRAFRSPALPCGTICRVTLPPLPVSTFSVPALKHFYFIHHFQARLFRCVCHLQLC